MKIAMYNLTTTCRFGGVESFVWEISRELAGRGHEVDIIGGRGHIRRNIPGVSLRLFPFWPREKLPNWGRRFRKSGERWSMGLLAFSSLVRQDYEVMHIHKPFDLLIGWMVKKFRGTRLVLGSHGTDFFPGDRLFAGAIDASVSCSDYNSRLIAERYGIRPEVIYNGIDPRQFQRRPEPDSHLERKYSVGPGEKIIIYAGRLIGLKGVKVLLRAMASPDGPSGGRLMIVGDGEERPSLESLAGELGIRDRVIFTGFVPNAEIPRYFSLARVGAFPTLADEAFGISICEAMACGLPVVATRVGGIPELVVDGVTGLLVRPGDVGELAGGLKRLLREDSLREEMAARAAEYVRERFTWEKVADRLLQVYDRILPQAGGPENIPVRPIRP